MRNIFNIVLQLLVTKSHATLLTQAKKDFNRTVAVNITT